MLTWNRRESAPIADGLGLNVICLRRWHAHWDCEFGSRIVVLARFRSVMQVRTHADCLYYS